jgi:hypothetical protein
MYRYKANTKRLVIHFNFGGRDKRNGDAEIAEDHVQKMGLVTFFAEVLTEPDLLNGLRSR